VSPRNLPGRGYFDRKVAVGAITPSADAILRLAEVFDVTTDYLLVETARRRPLHAAKTPSATSSPTSPAWMTTSAPSSSASSTP
jgi:hypothetical protein